MFPTLKELCTNVSSRSMTTHSLLASCGLISGRRCLTAAYGGRTQRKTQGLSGMVKGTPLFLPAPRKGTAQEGSPLSSSILAHGRSWRWAVLPALPSARLGVEGVLLR